MKKSNKELENDEGLECLENTIMVLETMKVGSGFCRTEIEALNTAIEIINFVKDFYVYYI